MNAFTKSVALLAAVVAAPTFASSDGTPGPTSSGTFSVTATVGPAAQGASVHVFGLDDFAFSWAEGGGGGGASNAFCITHSGGAGGPVGVSITISSFDAADTGFVVKTPGGGSSIELSVGITSNLESIGFFMVEGTPFTDFVVTDTCTDSSVDPNAMILEISTVNAHLAAEGIYSGSFLLTVAPG